MTPEQELTLRVAALVRKRKGNDSEASLRAIFFEYAGDDSQVCAKDLTEILKDAEVGNALTRGMWVKGVMTRLDINRDDFVSWDEFSAVITARAAKIA